MFKNTTSEVNIGGFPYINNYLHIYLPYSIVSCIATFLGLAGNILVVAAVLVDRKLRRNPTCILIVNLAFSDLLISIFVHPSIIIGVFFGKSFFDRHMNLCVFLGAACLISCGTSLMNMLFLALNRYISVFYFKKYSKYFSIRNTISLALIAWFIGIMADLPNFFGIGDHVYDLKVLSCHFDRLKVPYTFSFLAFCIILPGVFIGFLYLRIFLYAYRIRSKLKYRRNILKYGNALNAIKIAQSLFASFFTFFVCWIPVAIVMFMGTDDQLPISAHTFANLAAHVNSALNPILYLIFNPKMRTGYANLLRVVANNHYEFKRPTLTEKVASTEQHPKHAAVDEFLTNS